MGRRERREMSEREGGREKEYETMRETVKGENRQKHGVVQTILTIPSCTIQFCVICHNLQKQ